MKYKSHIVTLLSQSIFPTDKGVHLHAKVQPGCSGGEFCSCMGGEGQIKFLAAALLYWNKIILKLTSYFHGF